MIESKRIDWAPLILIAALALGALPFVGSPSTWVTLTVAGLAMGMMIFVMSSGLTLVFGLMDVINFGHGVFISIGAYVALLVLVPLAAWGTADSLGLNLGVIGLAAVAATTATGALGYFFERVVIRPVYGQHLKQILITTGGLIVAEQLIHALWGANPIPVRLPETLRGSFVIGDAAVERFRVFAILLGLAVFAGMHLGLNRTRIGLLIRAGVENTEMVEALGYDIRKIFVGVFVAGSALAGLGGVLWALYRQILVASMGMEMMVLIFIAIIIGGLGSVGGCFAGSILLALLANYSGFLVPKLALVSNIVLMLAILSWRPQGLYPVARR